jgi:hypothetical protein
VRHGNPEKRCRASTEWRPQPSVHPARAAHELTSSLGHKDRLPLNRLLLGVPPRYALLRPDLLVAGAALKTCRVATPALCPRIADQGRPRRASLLTFQSQGLPAAQLISVVDAAASIHREIYSRCFLALSFRQLPAASEAPPAFLHRFRRGAGVGSILRGSVARLTACLHGELSPAN